MWVSFVSAPFSFWVSFPTIKAAEIIPAPILFSIFPCLYIPKTSLVSAEMPQEAWQGTGGLCAVSAYSLTQVQCQGHSYTGCPGLALQGQKEEPKGKSRIAELHEDLCLYLVLKTPLQNNSVWTGISYQTWTPSADRYNQGLNVLQVISVWQNEALKLKRTLCSGWASESDTAKEALSPFPCSMPSLPAQVHLPWLRELLLHKSLHCLAQVLGWLPSPSLAAFAFCLNVQQVAKAGTGLGHLEQEHRHCIKPSTQTQPPSGLSHREQCLQRLEKMTKSLCRLLQLQQQKSVTPHSSASSTHPSWSTQVPIEYLFMDLVKVMKHHVYFIHEETEVKRDIPYLTMEKVFGLQQ